jgi:hypothetical protein
MEKINLEYIADNGYEADNAKDLQNVILDVYWEVARLFVVNVLKQDDKDELSNVIADHLCNGKTLIEIEKMYNK